MPFTIGNYLQNRAPIIIPAYPNQSLNKINDMKSGLWGLEKGIFPIEQLITHKFKLSEINKAMEIAKARCNDYIKGIIVP
jgi:threonine dehydrogenase-like Zn-dependent dehydrogenase